MSDFEEYIEAKYPNRSPKILFQKFKDIDGTLFYGIKEVEDQAEAWNHQQAKIDELKKLRSLDEMTISQLAQANQVWQSKCNELQARVDSLTNINESLVAYKNQLLDEIEEKGNKDEN